MAMFIHFCCFCPLGIATKLNFNISKVAYSKGRPEKLTIVVHVPQDFVISRFCFAEDDKEICKDTKRTYITIFLLLKPIFGFVLLP